MLIDVPVNEVPRTGRRLRDNTMPKRLVLAGLATLMAVSGFADGLLELTPKGERILGVVSTLAFGWLVIRWATLDSDERGHALWRGYALGMLIFPISAVVLPIYLVRTRGSRATFAMLLAGLFLFGIWFLGISVDIFVRVATGRLEE